LIKINLQIFSEKGEKNKCHHAMDSLKKAMHWDEQAYGREYDFKKPFFKHRVMVICCSNQNDTSGL
jgi:aminopeptidase N